VTDQAHTHLTESTKRITDIDIANQTAKQNSSELSKASHDETVSSTQLSGETMDQNSSELTVKQEGNLSGNLDLYIML